ncbi:alpha-1-antiproteinase-like [Neocloeon triangulifer]|uniref:alpha-1-antiproteinase-like n=1 Tax=Neocloeon triangulifer TaxID=2078957 RepID=UPI00286F12B7|nr:alpha-1-antiproteinase-like [Neocloeon triangulifer]
MSSPAVKSPFGAFGIKLYKVLQETEGNVVASPISAFITLAMALNGARGKTEAEMLQILQLPANREEVADLFYSVINSLKNTKGVEMKLANKAYIDDDFEIKIDYVATLVKSFLTTLESVNFKNAGATTKINDWVADATNQKIINLFPEPLDLTTRLVLVNALYFKGDWKNPFDRTKTTTAPFKSALGGNVDVQMMSHKAKFVYKKLEQYDAQLVVLPYEGGELSMVIILPKEEDGLPNLESKLGVEDLPTLLEGAKESPINLLLPRFKIESTHDLKTISQKLGLKLLFGGTADFSGITDEKVNVDSFVQKAYFEVNEEGAEGSVSSGISFNFRAGLPTMNCNHPFFRLTSSEHVQKEKVFSTKPSYSNMSSPVLQSPISGFGINFYKTLQATEGNVVASPISAYIALAMALMGARGGTETELRQALQLPSQRDEVERFFFETISGLKNAKEVKLKLANKAFIASNLEVKPDYVSSLEKNFFTTIESIDFTAPKATKKINNWIAWATNRKILTLFENDLPPTTKLVLVSALYFKGKWKQAFSRSQTETASFKSAGRSFNVQMMYQQAKLFYKELDQYDAKLVILPYEGDEMSMVIVLPNKEDGLAELEGKLGRGDLADLISGVKRSLLQLSVPRFKIESTHDLKSLLQKNGVNLIFSRNANFSGITDENVSVDSIMQKAFIEVNEEGAEAAAATGVTFVGLSALQPRQVIFNCDHPFLYFVLFKRSFTIFGGRVTSPA